MDARINPLRGEQNAKARGRNPALGLLVLAGALFLGYAPSATSQYKPVTIYANDNFPTPPGPGPNGEQLEPTTPASHYCKTATGGAALFAGTWVNGRSPSPQGEHGPPVCLRPGFPIDTNPANRVKAEYRCGVLLGQGAGLDPDGRPTCGSPPPAGVYSTAKAQGNACITPNCANPISIAIGNKLQVERDYRATVPFPLAFERTYNSTDDDGQRIGRRWRHSY